MSILPSPLTFYSKRDDPAPCDVSNLTDSFNGVVAARDWVRINQDVWFNLHVTWTGRGSVSSGSVYIIDALPIPAIITQFQTVNVISGVVIADPHQFGAYTVAGTTRLQLLKSDTTSGDTLNSIFGNDFHATDPGEIAISGQYIIA